MEKQMQVDIGMEGYYKSCLACRRLWRKEPEVQVHKVQVSSYAFFFPCFDGVQNDRMQAIVA